MEKLLISVAECCRLTGLSRTKVYQLLSIGELSAVKVGRSTRLPYEEVSRWISQLPRFGLFQSSSERTDEDRPTELDDGR